MDALEGIEEYVDQLTDKQKDWLNRFLEETVITNFQHKGALIYKTKKKRREFYRNNNERNRCMYTKARAMQALSSIDSSKALSAIVDNYDNNGTNSQEDLMITMMELKNSGAWESED